jgi:hypothetical protein
MLKDLWSGFSEFGFRLGDEERTFVSESALNDTDVTVSHYYALAMFKTGHCLPAPFFTTPSGSGVGHGSCPPSGRRGAKVSHICDRKSQICGCGCAGVSA